MVESAGGVTMPVLDIPRLLGRPGAEDARTEQAAINLMRKPVQTAYGGGRGRLGEPGRRRRGADVLQAGEVRARSAYDAARRLYGMGLDDITATLSAEQSWRTTRTALTAARVVALRQAVATYKALGGGWAYTTSDFKDR